MDSFARRICSVCNTHYSNLPNKGKPGPDNWTNMAAILMEVGDDLTIVSMATGTKCIGETDKTSWVISDSHAEILCLRLFRRFLAEELSSNLNGDKSCLTLTNIGKYEVVPGTNFHFYTTCVMCGDATIAENNALSSEKTLQCGGSATLKRSPEECIAPTKSRKVDGNSSLHDSIVRTGAKSVTSDNLLDGSLRLRAWNQVSVLRTKPGRGPVSLSLSCSDKLMKRQYLGLQGGLLSVFLTDPIRFKTIVIGGDCSLDSVHRSLFKRLPRNSVPLAKIVNVPDEFIHSLKNTTLKSSKPTSNSTSLLWVKQGGSALHLISVKGKLQGATKKALPQKVMLPVCRRAALTLACSIKRSLEGSCLSDDLIKDLESGCESANLLLYNEKEFGMIYRNFQKDSQYKEAKREFSEHFKGWDRKSLLYNAETVDA